MLKSALKTLAVLACSWTYAASAQAIEWNANSHRVLQGDYNSDGVTDFYLAAWPLPMVLPLNGLSVQVIPRTQHSFVLQSAAGGGYTVLRPLDMARVAQVAWTPAPYSTLVGDYNGDGLSDLLLRPDASGQDGLLLTQNAAGTPRLAQILNSQQLGIELSAAGGFQLQWKDVNGDGKADLLMTKAGVGNQVLLAGISGFSAAQAQAVGTVVSDKPLTASAGGIAEGAAEVSLDGTLSYSYPLTLPAGVNGLKPNLSIQYANNQADGYLGASWSLAGISAVSRCAASVAQDGFSGIPDGSSADKLCLDGQRLQLVSGTQLQPGSVYHTEQQSFTRVTLKGSGSDIYFEAQLKDGTTQVLGETLASRVLPVGSGKVQAWQLSSLRDAFNNKVDFSYKNSAGTLLPERISYAGAQIDFVYRDRSPSKSGYAFGGELRLEQLLQKITTSAPGGGAQQEYVLGYQVSNIAAPRISFLQHCATASGQAKQCLEASKFSYAAEPLGFSDQGKSAALKSFEGLASGDNSTLDWNGDGFTDLLSLEREALTVTLGGKNALGASTRVLTGATGANWRYFLAASAVDYNMDGTSEILVFQAEGVPVGQVKFSWRLLGANGSNVEIIQWSQATDKELSRYGTAYGGGYDPTLSVHQIALSGPKPLILDYSRDGRPDLILQNYGGWTKHTYNSGLGLTLYEGNAFLGSQMPWFSPFKLLSDGTWQLLTIVLKNGAYNYAIGKLCLRDYPPESVTTTPNDCVWQDLGIPVRRSVQLDINGDGNPDFVAPAADGKVYAYINKGGALSKDNFARIDLNLPTNIFADDAMRSTNEDYIPRPMDYDGDGRQDLLIIDKARNSYAVLRSLGQSFEKVNLDVPLMVAQEYLGVTGIPPQLPKINCTEWKKLKACGIPGLLPSRATQYLRHNAAERRCAVPLHPRRPPYPPRT